MPKKEKNGMPYKDNYGATKEDMEKGFTPGEVETEDNVPGEEMIGEDPERFNGGFCGRPGGWER